MKIFFSQIYAQAGVTFPFSHHLQRRLSEEVTALVEPFSTFAKKFGPDWKLIFRISAKRSLAKTEVRGPTVFKKTEDVEFSLFLPFDALQKESDVERAALRMLFDDACEVLERLGIDSSRVEKKKEFLIESLCSDPQMFENKKPNQSPQRNAGSRPSSADSSVSETPSSLGPRG